MLKRGDYMPISGKKSSGLLHIYEMLLTKHVVNKKDMATKLNVTTKTISRYIKDINEYLSEENKPECVIYSRKKGGYILQNKKDQSLSQKDILAISKVLLECRGFNNEEINILIHKLLATCQYEDRLHIKSLVANELINYVEPKHKGSLIEKIWDITSAIKQQKTLEIEYTKVGINGLINNTTTKRTLYPQGVLFSEYYFYLIAFIKDMSFEYPAIYRIDRIKTYEVLKERLVVDYKDRFKEGEFRKLIQFMQSGELQTVKFIFRGRSIEAVLDRLPTAEIIQEHDGEYLVQAKVFGSGIKMWLLSQGSMIKVIEPKEFVSEMVSEVNDLNEIYTVIK